MRDLLFTKAFNNTVGYEGTYYNHPNDPGGPTWGGVAYNFNREILVTLGIHHPSEMELKMNWEIVEEVYYQNYWVKSKCSHFSENMNFTLAYFDAVINCGVGGAGRILQEAINAWIQPYGYGIRIDGNVGPNTLNGFDMLLDGSYNPDNDTNDHNFEVTFETYRAIFHIGNYQDAEHRWFKNRRMLNSYLRRLG